MTFKRAIIGHHQDEHDDRVAEIFLARVMCLWEGHEQKIANVPNQLYRGMAIDRNKLFLYNVDSLNVLPVF